MSIVSMEQLNAHMSSPTWARQQQDAATQLLEDIEGQLAAALGTYISPPADPLVERVEISTRSGLVLLEYPVHTVLEVGGYTPLEGADAPAGYEVRNSHLYALEVPGSSGVPAAFAGAMGGAMGMPMVRVRYRPGWGDQPALHGAILERAAELFDNRHNDAVTVRDDQTSRNASAAVKPWSEDDLTPLRRFRRVGVFR